MKFLKSLKLFKPNELRRRLNQANELDDWEVMDIKYLEYKKLTYFSVGASLATMFINQHLLTAWIIMSLVFVCHAKYYHNKRIKALNKLGEEEISK